MNNKILEWNVDSVIIWITDSFPLKYYGLLFVTGLLLGHYMVKQIYRKENIPTEGLDSLLTYIAVGTILGARLGHCLFYEPLYYIKNPIEVLLPIKKVGEGFKFIGFQGLASHGGAIGVLIAILLYCRKNKTNLLWILDRVSIGIPITAGFIRLGNFMNSEIYGKATNGNWGVVFANNDLIPRHPTQLYEAFSYFAIFFILKILYEKRNEQYNGYIFGNCLILLFSARLIIEFFKENQVGFENQMILNMGQILSFPFILIGILLIIFRNKFTLQKETMG